MEVVINPASVSVAANTTGLSIDSGSSVARYVVRPYIKIEETEEGAVITCTDPDGTTTGTIYNGEQGPQGETGPSGSDGRDGSNGVTFTPSVSSGGVISWTNDGGLVNPESVNIKGPQGPAGSDGRDGTDGVTFTPSVNAAGDLSWSNDGGRQNPATVNIKGPQGETGQTGATGQNGANGVTFTPAVSQEGVISWTNDGGLSNPASVNIKGATGPAGTTDYTELTNKPTIPSTAADVGAIPAPASPTSGQFLVYNGTAWTAQTLAEWQGGSY